MKRVTLFTFYSHTHAHLNIRITKSAKLYFYETGLLCYLLKINDAADLKIRRHKGNLFENFVITEYIKQNYHQNLLLYFWFWRDAAGHEIDFIWQLSENLPLVEIKASETIMPEMFRALNYFEQLLPSQISSKTLVHNGSANQNRLADKVQSRKNILKKA